MRLRSQVFSVASVSTSSSSCDAFSESSLTVVSSAASRSFFLVRNLATNI